MPLRKFVPRIAFTALLLLAAGAAARGQAPPGPLPPKPGSPVESAPPGQKDQQKDQKKRPRAQVRVRVTEITAPVTVQDKKAEPVLDLSEKDFRVFDNGAEQKIQHFDFGGEPLSIALVVETSLRIEALLPAVRQAGIVFTQTVMGQTGEAAVIGYDDTVNLLQPFTGDAEQVEQTIAHLKIGYSGTRLYDAISFGVTQLEKQPQNRRRVMLVVGEAVDQGSENKIGEALREAQLANVVIYTVGLSTTAAQLRAKPKEGGPPEIGPPGTFPLPPVPGTPQTPESESQRYGNIDLLSLAIWVVQRASNEVHSHALEVASTATGGEHVSTFKDRTIEQAIDKIGGELHTQYMLGYSPPGEEISGFHTIKVEVTRPGVKVRSRPGYYIAPPDS
jgi:VWFA-related protein